MISRRGFGSAAVGLLLLIAGAAVGGAQGGGGGSLGVFTGSTDIGQTKPGQTVFNAATGTYTLTGGGADLWSTNDQFHFTWVKVSGDASLEADVAFPADDTAPKEKAILIIRQSLDPESAYADIALHGDGHIAVQWRATKGGQTEDATSAQHGSSGVATHLKIVRKGPVFLAYAEGDAQHAGALDPAGVVPATMKLKGPVYVGIGECAHDADGVHTAVFTKVKLTQGK